MTVRVHGPQCRCAGCRHERYAALPPCGVNVRRAGFYGHHPHGRARAKQERTRLVRQYGVARLREEKSKRLERLGVVTGSAGQVSGPIAYGPPCFFRAAASFNKYLDAPAPSFRRVA